MLIQNPNIGSGQNFWCLETGLCYGDGLGVGEAVGLTQASRQFIARSGLAVIGSVETAIPEPATMLLLGTALLGVAIRRSINH